MRRLLMSLVVLGLSVPFVLADDKPKAKTDPAASALESLTQEFIAAKNEFVARINAAEATAKKSGSPAKPMTYEDGPGPVFSPRFLALAEQNPSGLVGFQAVLAAVNTSGGPTRKGGTWSRAMILLKDHFAAAPEIKPLLKPLGASNDEDAESFLHEVMAKNPDRKIQAIACKSLADGHDNIAEIVEKLNENSTLRRNFESVRGKDYVSKMIASADVRKKEAVELRKILAEKYDGLVTIVSIGKPAPEIVSQDLDGRVTKLSSLKGKVVVLDIWATWCGPCRAMIPHEREMVERLKDKPFALISISADEKKETLKEFLKNEKMPWTHWWNGTQGGLIEDWSIELLPTIYVIDAEGVIRHKDLKDEKLEEAVKELLKDAEQKKSG